MSSTNKTTYYELPQFVDNDIFNPLVDDNDAYAKIDTALHNIAEAEADDASEIVGIKSRLDSAEDDIDALEAQNGDSVLTTTAQTLSGAVNELDADVSALDGKLDIVEDDINNASTGLKAKVSALETQNGNSPLDTNAQTLSGAINEIIATKGYVTPEMFGAIGDGTTNDTLAFQSAVNSGKPVVLIGDYLLDTITATTIVIYGNNHTIKNNDDGIIFNCTTFIADNLIIENKEIYNYQNDGEYYGTINATNVFVRNIKFININKFGIYAHNINADLVSIDTTFDVENIFDGSINNRLVGIWIEQSVDTKYVEIKNSYFAHLISGIYVGTLYDNKFTVHIHDNSFYVCGDHAIYLNSYGDRAVSIIENNIIREVTGSFAVAGNNAVVRDNVIIGGYQGTRKLFGLSLRHCNNVLIKHNYFKVENYETTDGIGGEFLITSLNENITEISDIVFEDNVFDIDEISTSLPWFRIGSDYLTAVNNLKFINNRFKITGFNSCFATNATLNNMIFNHNVIDGFNSYFFGATMDDPREVIGNVVKEGSVAVVFDFDGSGLYRDNKFDCSVAPIRIQNSRGTRVGNNTNKKLSGYCYNLGNDVTIDSEDEASGTITSTGTSQVIAFPNSQLLMQQLDKSLIITNSNHEIVTGYTLNIPGNGTGSVTGLAAGDYHYKIF